MSSIRGKKLCWNCEGEVHIYALQCPYCGVDLTTEETPIEENSPEEAPYRLVEPTVNEEDIDIPQPLYANQYASDEEVILESQEQQAPAPAPAQEKEKILQPGFKSGMKPLLLLLPGCVFFIFSLCLLFFANDGYLVLRWKSMLWPFYLIVSAPLLFFGWKSLQRLEEDASQSSS